MDDKPHLKGTWSGSHDPSSMSTCTIVPPERLKWQFSNFVCR